MGLLVIIVTASFGGWDGLPNPLGWVLVLLGVRAARSSLPSSTALAVLGLMALLISAISYPPDVTADLDPSAAWLLDLPQVAFEVVLCSAVGSVLAPKGRVFRLLMWVLVLVGVGPAIAIGTDDPGIADAVDGAFALSQIALVWMLFSVSGDPRTGAQPRTPSRQEEAGFQDP